MQDKGLGFGGQDGLGVREQCSLGCTAGGGLSAVLQVVASTYVLYCRR